MVEWSLGNANSGCTMMSSGKILRIGLSVSNRDIQVYASITENGFISDSAGILSWMVTEISGGNSGFRVLSTPKELYAGDRINFKTFFLYEENRERVNSILMLIQS